MPSAKYQAVLRSVAFPFCRPPLSCLFVCLLFIYRLSQPSVWQLCSIRLLVQLLPHPASGKPHLPSRNHLSPSGGSCENCFFRYCGVHKTAPVPEAAIYTGGNRVSVGWMGSHLWIGGAVPDKAGSVVRSGKQATSPPSTGGCLMLLCDRHLAVGDQLLCQPQPRTNAIRRHAVQP